ncbi:hypothetical protein ABZX51_011214 [Aspergillus tubingensis]
MHFHLIPALLSITTTLLFTPIVRADNDLDSDDVPDRCWSVCGPVVGITQGCDHRYDDNDRAELNCICNWVEAPTLLPLCEACIANYRREHDHDDDHDAHDNDAYDILTSCSLSTTTWNAAAATSALQSVNSTSATATATGSGAGVSGTGSAASTGGSAAAASSTGDVNGAVGVSVPGLSSVAVMLAMGMGYLGVV